MERKIAYILDSTLVRNEKELEGTDIFIQPLHVIVDGVMYKDVVDISVDEFYKAFERGAECSSSQPSPGEFAETYEKLRDQGYTEALVFTLSSGLSGTYNSAVQAAELVEDFPVQVVDSQYISAVGFEIAKKTIEFVEKNPEVDSKVVMAFAKNIFESVKIYVYIGDLDTLRKGGRLSGVQALVGKMLQVKPVISVEKGLLEVVVKERTLKKTLAKVAELASEETFNHVMLLNTSKTELRDTLEEECKKRFPEVEIEYAGLSPVIGTHAGSEATAVVTWTM